MHFYELNRIVRENTDEYRLYEWKQIEQWREQLASTSMQLSDRRTKSNDKLVDLIQEYREELRNEKNYEISDRLRDILEQSGIKEGDKK